MYSIRERYQTLRNGSLPEDIEIDYQAWREDMLNHHKKMMRKTYLALAIFAVGLSSFFIVYSIAWWDIWAHVLGR